MDFLMRTIVFALLFLALLHAFKPYLSDSAAANPREIASLARQVPMETAQGVAHRITSSQQPTVVVFYASWCTYCRQLMPALRSLWEEKKLEGYNLIFVSLDSERYPLASYLMENNLTGMIASPILYQKQDGIKLPDVMGPLGSQYKGGIPYIGFFKPGGVIADEINGLVDKEEILDSLAKLNAR